MAKPCVRILNGALDDFEGDIVLRGLIDPSSITLLMVDPSYQREVAPLSKIVKIAEGFKPGAPGRVADIDIGVRGGDVHESNGVFELRDPAYIIDGQQRWTAAKYATERGLAPRLGALVRFNTTREKEAELFDILNRGDAVSVNIHARNLAGKYPVIEMLLTMTTEDPTFALNGRVSWSQRMRREELLPASIVLKTVGTLHSYFGPGRSVGLEPLVVAMQTTMTKVGRATYKENVKTFFNLLDRCWNLNAIVFREHCVILRGTFLWCLARLLAEHGDFWKDKTLFIPSDLVAKLAQFPVTDPTVQSLSSSAGKARDMLFKMLVDHINSGKRTKRLTQRKR